MIVEVVDCGDSMIKENAFLVWNLIASKLNPLLLKVLVNVEYFIGHTLEQLIESATIINKNLFLAEIV